MYGEEATVAEAPAQQRIEGLPGWYFVLTGLLVASADGVREFQSRYPWVALVPLVITLVYVGLWFGVLRRRARYWRAVLRSPKVRLLAIGLAVLRMLIGIALPRLYAGPHEHLILAATMLILVPASAWSCQWLILRTLRGQPAADRGAV
jgi:hypothetical protein